MEDDYGSEDAPESLGRDEEEGFSDDEEGSKDYSNE